MNIQAMMKQAQKIQKDMMAEKEVIDNTNYTGTSSFVTVQVKGTKEIQKITLATEKVEQDEIEMLEDMILVAINDAMHQIDQDTEKKLGKYTQGLPSMF